MIFAACLVVAIVYLLLLVAPGIASDITGIEADTIRFWAVAVIVLIGFLAVLFIGAWIGWTLATTPPPKPLEELQKEIEKEIEENKKGAKTETDTRTQASPSQRSRCTPRANDIGVSSCPYRGAPGCLSVY